MRVGVKAESGNHGRLHGLADGCLLLECGHAVAELFLLTGIHGVYVAAVFYLAQIYDVVRPLYDKVYLCGWVAFPAAPGIVFRANTGDPQRLLDLLHVGHSQALVGQPEPGVLRERIEGVGPEMIVSGMMAAEVVVKPDVEICELVDAVVAVYLTFADVVLSDEITVLQIGKLLREIAAALFPELRAYLPARETAAVVRQQADDVRVGLRTAEKGAEQAVVFAREFVIFCEKQAVDVGRQSAIAVQKAQVVWHPA